MEGRAGQRWSNEAFTLRAACPLRNGGATGEWKDKARGYKTRCEVKAGCGTRARCEVKAGCETRAGCEAKAGCEARAGRQGKVINLTFGGTNIGQKRQCCS